METLTTRLGKCNFLAKNVTDQISRAVVSVNGGESEGSFLPIPELDRNDSQILLVFLSAEKIHFLNPVDDAFFSAHRPGGNAQAIGQVGAVPTYLIDNPVNVLGCATQYQICSPSTGNCTALTNGEEIDAVSDSGTFWPTDDANNAFELFMHGYTNIGGDFFNVITSLGAASLTARDTLIFNTQGSLPADQWQLEVMHWNSLALAMWQRVVVESATGPSDPGMKEFFEHPTTTSEKRVCQSQVSTINHHDEFRLLL